MGYYTQHELVITGTKNLEEVEKIENEIFEMSGVSYLFNDECKWYEHDEDMKKISLKYPDYIFELYGDGEEYGDLWKTYYKNGKMQGCLAKIRYDDFDVTKLK